jgi:hypothetical protein
MVNIKNDLITLSISSIVETCTIFQNYSSIIEIEGNEMIDRKY